ncbi:hypothetical protein C0J50_3511 [Silurus asotus]|uniref:Uncharacterized protein n=1 Tax=Silurus asotus TaxID=30991 RepID=A0AAD5FGG3_SILAS|nr:hypothetical protein C0J50_3511 [Silurus asotus]
MRASCSKKTNEISCLSLLWRACAYRAGPGRPEQRLRAGVTSVTGGGSTESGLLTKHGARDLPQPHAHNTRTTGASLANKLSRLNHGAVINERINN